MKNLKPFSILAIIGVLAIIVSCAGFKAPQIPQDLCSQFDASKSLLLKASEQSGIPLNEVYYGLLDSTSIALAVKPEQKDKIKRFMDDLAKWYTEHYPISYATLIDYMVSQEQAVLLSGIIMRRVGVYSSFLIISKYDDCLLRAGWKYAMEQLMLE